MNCIDVIECRIFIGDHGTSQIVSAFVVGDCDDDSEAQRNEHLYSCVDAAIVRLV
jgi:hypothetical protein